MAFNQMSKFYTLKIGDLLVLKNKTEFVAHLIIGPIKKRSSIVSSLFYNDDMIFEKVNCYFHFAKSDWHLVR